jgi:hypothetical protein
MIIILVQKGSFEKALLVKGTEGMIGFLCLALSLFIKWWDFLHKQSFSMIKDRKNWPHRIVSIASDKDISYSQEYRPIRSMKWLKGFTWGVAGILLFTLINMISNYSMTTLVFGMMVNSLTLGKVIFFLVLLLIPAVYGVYFLQLRAMRLKWEKKCRQSDYLARILECKIPAQEVQVEAEKEFKLLNILVWYLFVQIIFAFINYFMTQSFDVKAFFGLVSSQMMFVLSGLCLWWLKAWAQESLFRKKIWEKCAEDSAA